MKTKEIKRKVLLLLLGSGLTLLANVYPVEGLSPPAVDEIPQTLTSGNVVLPEANETISNSGRKQTFVISAYYSPIAGQTKYVTGSLAGDIRLNGDGVKSADGTTVYPGMVAAPKSYPFGTKMLIPGIGTVAVHDRGGAIVHNGERGNSHDRLDIWMGYGDAGLKRALKWGKRAVEVTVYGVNSEIKEEVYLEGYSENEKYVVANSLTFSDESVSKESVKSPVSTINFGRSLSKGMKGEEVGEAQSILKNLNYYEGEISSVYDDKMVAAVKKFQIYEKIVSHEYAYGAGYLGPKTMQVLASKINLPSANAATEAFNPVDVFSGDLKPGDSGEAVKKLQDELKRINLLGVEPTGNYGEVTEHAVFKFQQINKLVGDLGSNGAGIFGPKTRGVFNSLLGERQRIEKLVADRKINELP